MENSSKSVLSIGIAALIERAVENSGKSEKELTGRGGDVMGKNVANFDIEDLLNVAESLGVEVGDLVPSIEWWRENKNKKVSKTVKYEIVD